MSIRLQDATFGDLEEAFAENGIDFEIDPVLRQSAAYQSARLTVHLTNAAPTKIARAAFGGVGIKARIAWESGKLRVVSYETDRSTAVTHVYATRDLINWLTMFTDVASPYEHPSTQPDDVRPTIAELDREIRVLIVDSIESDSWKQNGGWATIETDEQTHALVIFQSPSAHEQIAVLMEKLRETRINSYALQRAIEEVTPSRR